MRHALLAAGLALLAAHAAALDLADPAPPLSVTTWVQGGPVDLATLRGKGIAVVAFWATWCAPSERAIETLASLQREHAGHGLVVVGVTVADPNNDLAKVRAFVEKKGPVLPYAVGFDDGETTWRDWMVASGAKSVSTGFLVDREGRIAWIGDPQRGLERAVADLLAGRHSAERARRIKDLERRFDRAAASSDWAAALAAADELVADAPGRGNARRCHAHLRMGRPADALAAAKSAVEALEDAETLVALARSLAGHRAEGRPFEDLAIRALDRAIELAPESSDVPALKFDYLFGWGRTKEAQEAGALIVQRLDDSADGLNNFAWGLLTEDSKKGKFNPLALLAASRASELAGGESWYILDTLALARFEMGEPAEAVRLEEKAIEIARRTAVPEGQIRALEDALARFRKGR